MRVIGVVLVAMGLATAAAAQPAPLPAFEFKTLKATMTAEAAKAAGAAAECRPQAPPYGVAGEIVCSLHPQFEAGGVAGAEAVRSYFTFTEAGLKDFTYEFYQADYAGLKVAFGQRYGKPCGVENSPVQNSYGATFNMEVTSWCFAEGKLILMSRSLGRRPQNGEFQFMSNAYMDALANPKPKVNF